jgi:hypothetical protein
MLGSDTEGGTYARVDGEPEVFVVSRELRDAARRSLVDRSTLVDGGASGDR